MIPVPIDALGVIASTATATNLMEVLKGAVGRQVGDVAAAVLSELKMKNTISTPEVFHYLPEPLSHHVTLVYSKAATMSSFETFRRSLHTSFLLPQDRPLGRPPGFQRTGNSHRGCDADCLTTDFSDIVDNI